MKWQAGLFIFSQRYSQTAVNTYSPFVLDPMINFTVAQTTPDARLNDVGFGIYGQTTFNVRKKLDVTVGLRADREDKDLNMLTSFAPVIQAPATVNKERNFRNWSPEFAGVYHFDEERMAYISFGRGFKSGGFNAASPTGSETYGGENAYHLETGAKANFAADKITATAAAFLIDWNSMQMNLSNPLVPAQFYIANVDGARSRGFELELRGRPHPDVDVFAGLGFTRARFDEGTVLGSLDVSRNPVPNAPQHTYSLGTDIRRKIIDGLTFFGHADAWFNGGFKYDETNTAGQKAYSLVNFRAGVQGSRLRAEFWMKNAANTLYIPIAFAYSPMLAPSGYIGEMGAPRRYGVTAQIQID
jgi:iron complex outermembrane receptor protein